MHPTAKKVLIFLLKLSLILGIFGFLFYQAVHATDEEGRNVFQELLKQPKRWDLLVAAAVAQFFAIVVTIIRLNWLVRALGMDVPLKDTFRLGFLGQMLNLAPMGIVGGDVVKAYLLSKRCHSNRSDAVAGVIVDRVVGLLVLFLLGVILIFATGFVYRQEIWAKTACHLVLIFTAIGYVGTGIVFLPFFANGRLERLLGKIPVCGNVFAKLTRSLLLYRNHKACLLRCYLITFLVHLSCGFSAYLIARGLFSSVPRLLDHLMIYSVANLTSMIPLAAGPLELVMNYLYPLLSTNGPAPMAGAGLIIGVVYRFLSILVASIGIVFYLSSRDEIREAEAETEAEMKDKLKDSRARADSKAGNG